MATDYKNSTAMEGLKTIKNYALGVLAFDTAITTFLVQVFHFPVESTLAVAGGVSGLFLVVVFLIWLTEKRIDEKLKLHMDESDYAIAEFRSDMEYLKKSSLESQRSTLRIEMDNEIFRNPSNHDTIIKYAYRYFKELNSDWVETEKFLTWMDKEEKEGRPVHLPADLLIDINNKAALENLR